MSAPQCTNVNIDLLRVRARITIGVTKVRKKTSRHYLPNTEMVDVG